MSSQGSVLGVLLIAALAILMWRQVLMLAAACFFVVFWIGALHVAQILHG